jgi:hypothetical protein
MDDPWQKLPADAPDLFTQLRELDGAEVYVRFRIGIGEGTHVEVPAATLTVQGRLGVEPVVDRFAVEVPGWGPEDFAWFARRKGRGRPDYWQGAIEYHGPAHPALILYFTAPPDALEISVKREA